MTTADMMNCGWRNFLSSLMGLDMATFQLAQGTLGLQTSDSSGLFLMSDAVPPPTAVNYYDATSMNKRSSAYLGLLSALLPETNPHALSDALGSQYGNWISWKAANPPKPAETYLAYFQRWGTQSGADPGMLARGEQAIMTAQNTPLIQACAVFTNPIGRQSFVNSAGTAYALPIYTTTHEAALNAIANGASIPDLNFDSATMNTKHLSGLPPAVSLAGSGPFGLFAGRSGALAQLNKKASSQRVTIAGKIGSYATLVSGPGSWYTSNEVTRAFNGKNSPTIWDPGAASGDWGAFFGQPNGALARYVSQLVLISDYQLTVTIHGLYTKKDVQQLTDSSTLGAWPLFSSAHPPTQEITYKHNPDSTITVVHQLDPGKVQIWGVTVQPAP